MVRKKVRLNYIENNSARRITYNKRVKGIIKKTEELSVLCGVDACAIIYGPYNQAPKVWPSSELEANRIISNYRGKPDILQSQRRLTQQSYLDQSVEKAKEKLMKLQWRNREIEMENVISDILSGKSTPEHVSPSDLEDLLWVIEDKMRTIQYRITVDGNKNIINKNPSFPDPNTNDSANLSISPVPSFDHGMEDGDDDVMGP